MDIITLALARKYTNSVALSGVPVMVPQINPTTLNWEVWNPGDAAYVDTGVRADGRTPEIGGNGNWWIGGTDTGKPSRGESGIDGREIELRSLGSELQMRYSEDYTRAATEWVPVCNFEVLPIPAVITDYVPGATYAVNAVFINPSTGFIYRVIRNYTSVDLDTDVANGDIRRIGGGVADTYIHEQTTPATTWLCQHNLGNVGGSIGASVVVIDDTGHEVVGFVDRSQSTDNLLVVVFDVPLSGKAYVKK